MQPTLEFEKLAATEHPILDLLARRWNPLAFSSRPVEPEKLRSVLEAARWAPSSYNAQPWSFVVVTRENPAAFDRLLDSLVQANRQWARHAPVLMFAVAKVSFDHNGRPNRHALYDLGQAVANMVIQATALDLLVHQMAGFQVDKAREILGLPEGYEPVAAIALGYEGDPDSLPEPLRRRHDTPRTRKPLDSFVFQERWGAPGLFLVGSGGK